MIIKTNYISLHCDEFENYTVSYKINVGFFFLIGLPSIAANKILCVRLIAAIISRCVVWVKGDRTNMIMASIRIVVVHSNTNHELFLFS